MHIFDIRDINLTIKLVWYVFDTQKPSSLKKLDDKWKNLDSDAFLLNILASPLIGKFVRKSLSKGICGKAIMFSILIMIRGQFPRRSSHFASLGPLILISHVCRYHTATLSTNLLELSDTEPKESVS
ncbi:hypothetical protein J6590_087148 [Homalodisca vitripennis]|nr:hypothetical protein J6590_049797 [Homalodisca vitripennis]KAG8324654.1 hypothetical protein J6590_087148 [Homalodisca vitripennis]